MKNLIYILLIAVVFSSCSEFQKALKSEDTATKFKLGTELYEQGKYSKAHRLFAQIVPNYAGKPQAEKLMFMYANSSYMMKDYYISGHQFERFENRYSKSEKVEEASFLSAKSYYHLSPVYSKEQQETKEALEKLQLFINKYPDSKLLPEANKLIKELDYKLEKKAFEIAKQYNKIAYFESSDYEAAIKAFDNFLADYPGTSFREQAMFYRLDSAYRLGINSIESKKQKRLDIALGYFNAFKRYYGESELIEDAEKMNQDMLSALEKYNTKS
ncbi:outer membrane protein assembly factor BamD [Ichthyenterobacterium magnum]|uniref:Beta-barrel assembly machine subunit BamD n=1 Tax=Ichthyenterobacterium magnum TaxID=1230530 RepID=A0A420DLJ9_9FLAO|nr:outer membrane protein assembly factor BamD [Ichthyenterobacterium magnum]RKE95078.1 Beta-barrel assembly machine subunit BamD [Ichthyenterobacterium magnum]